MKMSILNRISRLVQRSFLSVGSRIFSPSFFAGLVREANSGDWQKGITTDPLGELTTFGAVYACLSRIANDFSKLDVLLMVWNKATKIWEEAPDGSPFWIPLIKPNKYQNRIQFFTAWIISKLLYGNTFVLKARDERGVVKALYVLDARRVTPLLTEDGAVYYQIGMDLLSHLEQQITVPASEIIHDRCITLWHPLIGVSPLYACAISTTQGRLIQANSQKFFRNMSRPSGILTSPGTIGNELATRMKVEWEAAYKGENLGKVAVLGDGLEYKPMSIPPETAQMIQQLGWTVEDVGRAFSMPLYKINSGPIPTSNNVEALETQYYSGCLQILFESAELCLAEGLEVPRGYKVQFDLAGLLRMDSLTQIDALAKAVAGALMTIDEGRQKLNLPPQDGGNSVYMQQQNYSLAALAKRDAREDPFASAKPPAPPPVETLLPKVEDEEEDFPVLEDGVEEAAAADVLKSLLDRLSEEESLLA